MQASAHPPGFDQIRREELGRVFERVFATRRILQPVLLLLMLSVVLSDLRSWRSLVIITAPLLAMLVTLAESHRLKQQGPGGYAPSRDFVAFVLIIPVATLCTGGVHSPFLIPLLPLLVFLPMFSDRRATRLSLLVTVALIWSLALARSVAPWTMPRVFLEESGGLSWKFGLFSAVALTVFAVAANQSGLGLRQMSDKMLERALSARAEALELYQERLRDLTLLSGEIAHELKNPLSTIKGLGQLMEVESPRNPERLRVLRGEVERMQGILEEFLNFSRPLAPLTQSDVDVSELCREVVGLHEGVAAANRLTLVGPNEHLRCWCDARKVKQIVVNLVQNAVEASSSGGEVLVAVARRDDFAAIQVLDRGHGLADGVGPRAFDSGVTSKARGSGLGLTIVRTLAEQHRGSARLFNRDGGGCVAEVLLPCAPGASVPVASLSAR
jgi:signal transduction histidine kinase